MAARVAPTSTVLTALNEKYQAQGKKEATTEQLQHAIIRDDSEFIGLTKGDTFTIDENPKVWADPTGSTYRDGTPVFSFFINVLNQRTGQPLKLLLSNFKRIAVEMDDKCYPTGKTIFSQGTASEAFKKNSNYLEAVKAIQGKTLMVTDIQLVRIQRFGTNLTTTTQVPTIDFVDQYCGQLGISIILPMSSDK